MFYPIKSISFLYLLITLLVLNNSLFAQESGKLSYYQEQQIEKADNYFELGEYINAANIYIKIHRKAPDDTLLAFKVADCYKKLNSYNEAEKWYSVFLQEGNPMPKDKAKFMLDFAQLLTINGKYDDALYWYTEYFNVNSSDPRGKAGILTIENLNKLYHDTIFYVVYPSQVNTAYSEFCPTPFENGILFCSDRPKAKISESNKGEKISYLNWYFSEIDEFGKLESPMVFNKRKTINTLYNEGPAVFFNNGNGLVFTQNTLEDKNSNEEVVVLPVQLYIVEKGTDGKWGEPYRLPFCHIDYSYAQPAISSDGKTLVFSSNLPGGFGEADLYVSRRSNGNWSKPENLGKRFNSKGNDMFPFLLNDTLLYFSSDGHGGLGGLDICYAPMDEDEDLKKFGFPMNSSGDDFGIMYDDDGMSGFLSSNRETVNNKDNIYAFKIVRISFTLKIIDINTSTPVKNAEVFSVSGLDEELVGKTDQEGYCNVILPVSKEIKMRIKTEDYESLLFTYEPVKYKTDNMIVLPVDLKPEKVEEIPDKKPISYKVQVMASRKKATQKQIKKKYKGKLPVKEIFEDNWYKYIIGEFDTFQEACECLQKANVYDAFIAAYIENKRVTLIRAKSEKNEDDDCWTERRLKNSGEKK